MSPRPMLPRPIPAMTMRSLAAGRSALPNAEDVMMVGSPYAAVATVPAVLRKSRRVPALRTLVDRLEARVPGRRSVAADSVMHTSKGKQEVSDGAGAESKSQCTVQKCWCGPKVLVWARVDSSPTRTPHRRTTQPQTVWTCPTRY